MLLIKFVAIITILLILEPSFTNGWWRRRRRRRSPPVRCPDIGYSNHRSTSFTNSYNQNSRCTFSCATGYYVDGVTSVVCQSSGKWSASFPTCSIRICAPPPTPSHGSRNCPHYNYGSTCSFYCNSGYSRCGSITRYCNGYSWSGNAASCRDIERPRFTNCPRNIVTSNDNSSMSAVVTYSTPSASDNSGSRPSVRKVSGQNSGSSFSGGVHSIRFRATDGSWNYADCVFSITVNVISCSGVPSQAGRNEYCPNKIIKGATCSFGCGEGYFLNGQTSVSCDVNGDWSHEFPNCNAIMCPQLSAPTSGSFASCSRSYGSICTFRCNTGYVLVGSPSSQCSHMVGQRFGFWSEIQPICRISTCPLPSVGGGLRSVSRSTCNAKSDSTVNYGSECQYECSTGYYLSGSDLRICRENGNWAPSLPVCIVDDICKDNICNNGGTCVIDNNTLGSVHCICTEGFTGEACEYPIDFCLENQCQNNAHCVSATNNYTCICPENITGRRCQVVNGGWSDWSAWNACPVTCGGGTQTRERQCNNPSPSKGGVHCRGLPSEVKTCQNDTCPARVRRSAVKVAVQIGLPVLSCDSDSDQLAAQDHLLLQLQTWKADIPCLYEELCTISNVAVSHCYPRTYYPKIHIHKSVATATISLVRNITNMEGGNADSEYDIDKRLQESVDTIKKLVTTHGLDFGWTEKILIQDNSTIFVDGWDMCPPGTIESHHEHFCYPCPQGSYRMYDYNQEDLECQPCPRNYYQDKESAEMCNPCPNGQKTLSTGSTALTDCLEDFQHPYWNGLDEEPLITQLYLWRMIGITLIGISIISASVLLCRGARTKV